MDYNIVSIQEKLKLLQNKKRFLHTLGVQYTAANLAMCYGLETAQAEIAGLLHDCAKYMDEEQMLMKCQKYRIPMTEIESRYPFLLHAKLGAYYARNKYGIEDEEVLYAITYHTTGKPDMSMLEKIIFIADYIEPSRKSLDGLCEIRKTAYRDINLTMYLILEKTLDYLKYDTNREIDPATNIAYDYYIKYKPKGVIK